MVRRLLLSASLLSFACTGSAHAAWQQASSTHFIVYADDKPERIRAFTERLEKFDKALRIMRGIGDAPLADAERVRVFMVADLSQIKRLAGKDMSGVAGWYSQRPGGPVAFVPRDAPNGSPYDLSAQAILLHEYTHHFMFLNWPNAVFPPWLVEGFAEFHATAIFEKDGDILLGQAPGYRVWNLENSTLLPASRLIQLDPGKLSDEQTDALYSRGWLLTHYLTFDSGRGAQLGKYIAAINAGKNADEAAKVFGDLKKLDRDLTAYISRPKITVARIPAAKLTIGTITIAPLTAGEAAVMPARLRSTRGVDSVSAKDVVTLARKLAAPFPNDAGAQNELAEAEFDAGNYEAARTAADRAIAADAKSIHALIYRGLAESEILRVAGDKDAAHWRAARRWFIAANKIDPDNPEPLMLFYYSFANAGIAPTTNAEDGLLTAYRGAPFASDLRMTAAGIYLARKNSAEARAALLPIAYGAHQGSMSKVALAALQAIDGGDTDKAIAVLRAAANPDSAKQG
jgi:tetratricopeptide (TPR) repeat protein